MNGAVDLLLEHVSLIKDMEGPSALSLRKYLCHLVTALVKAFDSVKSPFSLFVYDDISLLVERLVDMHNYVMQHEGALTTPQKGGSLSSTTEVFNYSKPSPVAKTLAGRPDFLLEAFMDVHNFSNLRVFEFVKKLYQHKKLVHVEYVSLWTEQLVQLVKKNLSKSELFNLYFENLFQEDLFYNQIFILRLLGFVQKNGGPGLLRHFYLNYLNRLSEYLNKLVDVAFSILKKFDKSVQQERKPEAPGRGSRAELSAPSLEEVPENIITGVNFDDYNVKIKAAVNLLLETFKFYYRLIRFADSDEVVQKYFLDQRAGDAAPNSNPGRATEPPPSQTPKWELGNSFFVKLMKVFQTCFMIHYKKQNEISKCLSPRLFDGILRRYIKNQKYLKNCQNDRIIFKCLQKILQDTLHHNEQVTHQLVWEKMVCIFNHLGRFWFEFLFAWL